MKRFILMFAILALITSCKSSASVAPIILKDSISITYKQGVEQPASIDAQGAAIESRKNSCVPAAWCPRQTGKPYLGKGQTSTQGASVFEGLLSQRTNKPAVPPTTIRVDTVFIERWHTQTVPTPPPRGESVGASKFYKDCTKGFWVLLILFLGSFAFRILKAIYLKR